MQLMQSGESTNRLLRTLLTTTPSASHISDFRQQRRTDSRADKPETFPGFDLEDNTLSPRKRRRQAYSQLIRGLLEKTRERLETIRDVVNEEKHLRFRLPDDDESEAADQEVTIFEFTDPDADEGPLADENGGDASHVSPISSAYTSSVPRKYFSTLLGAIGFNRVAPTPSMLSAETMAKNQIATENSDADGSDIFATYLFKPLLHVWHLARKKFNFNLNGDNDGASASANNANDANDDDNGDELQLTIVYGTDGRDGSDSENDNINQLALSSYPSTESSNGDDSQIENMPSTNNGITKLDDTHKQNITIDGGNVVIADADDDIRSHTNSKRNAPSSSKIERAAQAFQNAFFKYSNYMPATSDPSSNVSASQHESNAASVQHKSTSTRDSDRIDGAGLLADFLDDSRSNIQIVPSGKSKTNTTTMTTTADADDTHSHPKRQSVESAGILILEMFGTVIGLTWGAFSHVQSYFNNNRNNETMTWVFAALQRALMGNMYIVST